MGEAAPVAVTQRGARRLALVGLVAIAPLKAGAQVRAPAPALARIAAIRCDSSAASAAAAGRPVVPPRLRWRGSVVRWTEWTVQLGRAAITNRIVVAVVDPSRVTMALDIARQGEGLGPWTIAAAPAQALIAFNAGQFTDDGPWGWVRHNGRDQQAPGAGALAGALVVDSAGQLAILPASALAAARATGRWREAVQSYPQLLANGEPLPALCGGDALDLSHRDARLVVATRADGQLLVLLSRFAGTGSGVTRATERVPIGPTTPEMAEIARRLGAVDALMLDGGLSAQLLLRSGGVTYRWPGLRAVPLALVGTPRRPLP